MSAVEGYRCSYCGAPLDVSPETIAIVCSYCGYLNWVREDLREEVYVVKPAGDEHILSSINSFASRKRLGEVFKPSNLSKLVFVLIPFYFVDISAEADYSGLVAVDIKRCRREKEQTRCWIETKRIYVSGVYGPYRDLIPIPGRRGLETLSAKAIAYVYTRSPAESIPLARAGLDKRFWGSVLSVEIDKKTAIDFAIDSHLDILRELVVKAMRREAEHKALVIYGGSVVGSRVLWKRITPRNINARSSPPILLPMFVASYRYRDGVYRAIACGWNGMVIALERPMKTLDRVLWGLASATGAGLLGGIAGLFLPVGGAITLIISALMLALGGYISWYCMRRALSPVKTTLIGVNIGEIKRHAEQKPEESGVELALDFLRRFPGLLM